MDIPAVLLPTNCIPEEYTYMESCPCPCGAVGYELVQQSLNTGSNGAMWDELSARCSTCGAERTFCFDVSQCVGKTVPEKPSQLFDLVEWTMVLFHFMRIPLTGEEGKDLTLRMRSWVAVEQALLFFDEGVETPRAEAFFHTTEPPMRIRQYLSRQFLEPIQTRMRADMGWPPGESEEDRNLVRPIDKTHDEAPAEGWPSFQVICATCGRDSDADDTVFRLAVAVPFPGSECLLAGLTCAACGTRVDRVLWPVDTEAVAAALGEAGPTEPDTIALRARYDRVVADYRTVWEQFYATRGEELFGKHTIDLSAVSVVPSATPKTVVDARVLAAAQACREVALRFPGHDPAGMLLIGPFRCALSLDRSQDTDHRGILHLSVSQAPGLGPLRRIEEAFLTGLYFTADERPFLAEEYGQTVPCTHVRYPLPVSP